MPARPLRGPGERLRRPARPLAAVLLLVLALVAPMAVAAPFGAWADDDPAAAQEEGTGEDGPGLPYWQVLRPEGGERWTDANLHAVHFPTDEVGYAVGGGADGDGSPYGLVLVTRDGGDNWSELRLRLDDEIGDLRDVHFVTEDRGFAVGDSGQIVGTDDGGETWRRLASGVEADLHGVHFPTDEVGYTVGDVEDGRYTVLKTDNAGASWRQLTVLPEETGQDLYAVHFADEDTGVATGSLKKHLRTTDGGSTWTSSEPSDHSPARGVALLEGEGVGYSVGDRNKCCAGDSGSSAAFSTVHRTIDGFATAGVGGQGNSERTVGDLYGVAAYWAATPVSDALDLLGSVLVDGPSAARDPVADALDDLAERIREEKTGDDDEVDGALEELAGELETLAGMLRDDDTGDEEWQSARETLEDEVLPVARDTLVFVLETAADTTEDRDPTGVDEVDDAEEVNDALDELADALRELAEAIEGLDADEADDTEDPAPVEIAHAVGVQNDLPVALTRPGGPHKAWVLDPIEDWDDHQGATLRGVSASPDAGTVVAVGDDDGGGLILRRTAGPADAVCVPRSLAEELADPEAGIELPEGVPVCGEEAGERQDPEDPEVIDIPPPLITLSPALGGRDSVFTVSGDDWRACEDPENREGCEGSEVALTFRQGDEVFALATVGADADGDFEAQVRVPDEAVGGDATVRAEGDPAPDGGASAEASFTVPGPPTLVLLDDEARPKSEHWPDNDAHEFRIDSNLDTKRSRGWHACDPGGACEGATVEVWFLQDGREDVLLTDEALEVVRVDDGLLPSATLEVPESAVAGKATVRAEAVSEPVPDGGGVAEAGLTVLPPLSADCEIGVEEISPDLPCVDQFELTGEEGTTHGGGSFRAFVPGIGEVDPETGEPVGRLVAVSDSRVFLYDVSDKHVEVISVAGDGGSAEVKVNEQTYAAAEPGDELALGFVVEDIFAVESEDDEDGEDVRWCVTFRLAWASSDSDLGQATFKVCEGERVQQGLTQRGVPGFAEGFTGASRHGDVTGVVNLEDVEVDCPEPSDDPCQLNDGEVSLNANQVSVALDTDNQRLYFRNEKVITGARSSVVAMSLAGEFPPTAADIGVPPRHDVTHLAVDAGHSMLYAVSTGAGEGGLDQNLATTVPQSDVLIHGVPARVVDGEMRLGLEQDTGVVDGSQDIVDEAAEDAEEVADELTGDHTEGDVDETVEEAEKAAGGVETGVARQAQPAWSLSVGELCDSTTHNHPMLGFFGLSSDGRRLHVPCKALNFTFIGVMGSRQNGILTVTLPGKPAPDELTRADTERFVQRYTPVPGPGMGISSVRHEVFGDQATGVLVWRAVEDVLFWDLDRAMWIGRATLRGGRANVVAADPTSGQVYLTNREIPIGSLATFQVANLPGSFHRRAIPTGLRSDVGKRGAFDPGSRRLVSTHEGGLKVLEDRVPPTLPRADVDPDDATNDIDEERAISVDRTGVTSAYGTRVWQTGLRGVLPGTYMVSGDEVPTPVGPNADQEPPAGLTYDWLFRTSAEPHGRHTTRVPWRPHERDRELVSAAVPEASLVSGERALTGRSPGRSQARAVGLGIDEGTGGDVRQRRGAREWRDVLDVYVREFCDTRHPDPQGQDRIPEQMREECKTNWFGSDEEEAEEPGEESLVEELAAELSEAAAEDLEETWREVCDAHLSGEAEEVAEEIEDGCHQMADAFFADEDEGGDDGPEGFYGGWSQGWSGEDAQAFDDCTDELWDRALREVDGQRRVNHVDEGDPDDPDDDEPDPCFPPDPDDAWNQDEQRWENDRPGLEQHLGLTQGSECVMDLPGAQQAASQRGSTVVCDLDGEQTMALAENAFDDDEELFFELPDGATLRVEATFTLTRSHLDAERGMVSEANAFAQGVELDVPGAGGLRIGQVATRAESWAAGRPGTAGSSYSVSYSDVELTGEDGRTLLACQPSGQITLPVEAPDPPDVDEEEEEESGQACDVEAVFSRANQALGGVVEFSVPGQDTDGEVVGSDGGARARVQRDRADYWNDRVLFGVDREEVSGLRMSMVADGTQFNRYRVDLAGVFTSSNYEIGQPWEGLRELPGQLEVGLTDHAGAPLSGGRFALVADDGDRAGEAVRACETGSDGVGDCRFSSLDPGAYLVEQTAAPHGYLPQQEAVSVFVAPQANEQVTFVNVLDAGTVEVTLTDPDGTRLEGGAFELVHADGGAESCITSEAGGCQMSPLPLGAYTLTQTRAPEGFVAAEPIDFALTEPGQVAQITVVNGRPGTGGSRTVVEIVELLDGTEPAASLTSQTGQTGQDGWFRRVAEGLRSLLRNPAQALALALVVVLLATPVYLAVRRRELGIVRELT